MIDNALQGALDDLLTIAPDTTGGGFYIEARVGPENYRGDEVRLIVDRRFLSDEVLAARGLSQYENANANVKVGAVFDAINRLRQLMLEAPRDEQERMKAAYLTGFNNGSNQAAERISGAIRALAAPHRPYAAPTEEERQHE